MTKKSVLEIFSQNKCPLSPDAICRRLNEFHHRSSVYSYLFRLHKQGLLNREQIDGRIVYSISQRGIERLKYFKSKGEIS